MSRKGLTVWRWYGLFQFLFLILVAIGVYFILDRTEADWKFNFISLAVLLLHIIFFMILFPKVRWMRWRYEVREAEIELQHGLFIVKRTLIPMIRVQHVDTTQGPLLRKYNLAVLTISTAATVHAIPAIAVEEADALRQQISVLARVAKEDV
ncbi:MAG TPA: PH domain-containing protein [Savagea sp.]